MQSNKSEWKFYLVVGVAVTLNEVASASGLQFITFLLVVAAVIWAGARFLSKEEPGK
jgi:hypothetical protein